MELLFDILSVCAVGAVVILAARIVKRFLVLPMAAPGDTFVYLVAAAKDSGEGLEETVRALERLRRETRLTAETVIYDGGLTGEGRKRALITAKKFDVIIMNTEDLKMNNDCI